MRRAIGGRATTQRRVQCNRNPPVLEAVTRRDRFVAQEHFLHLPGQGPKGCGDGVVDGFRGEGGELPGLSDGGHSDGDGAVCIGGGEGFTLLHGSNGLDLNYN